MATSAYVFSDKAWWHDTPSVKSSLKGKRLMASNKIKCKKFSRTWLKKRWMLDSNMKIVYILGMKNLIKPFFYIIFKPKSFGWLHFVHYYNGRLLWQANKRCFHDYC